MNTPRILVAVSLTADREAAFERAVDLARTSSAELYLLHAVPANQPFSSRAVERLTRMAELRDRAEAEGLAVTTAEQHGDPAEIIVLHANARNIDLIVMGTEGRRGWKRIRNRSVAERVLRRTSVPTLIVPSDDTTLDGSAFRHVMVAVDLQPSSSALVDAAVRFAGQDARTLTVLHSARAIEADSNVQSPARWMVPEYRGYVIDDARRQLEGVVPSGAHRAMDVQVHVATGAADEAILAHAADVQADLIVVGGSRRFMHLGSAAARVLRKAERPLLVVPLEGSSSGVVPVIAAAYESLEEPGDASSGVLRVDASRPRRAA